VKSGELRKIAPRVYTSNLADTAAAIVSRNLYLILGRLFPGALLSHRTALEGKPAPGGDVFLTSTYGRTVRLPGVTVHQMKGPGPTAEDMPIQGMFMSSQARAFLENFQISRSRTATSKVLSREEVENRLDRICAIRGADGLNRLRDRARAIASPLGMERAFRELDKTVGAILRTRPADSLSSDQARARSRGTPYDPHRIGLFNELFSALVREDLAVRPEPDTAEEERQNLSFFEAYFSNYIEGTEFEIGEAHDIVFGDRIPADRPDDAHDILGTYRTISSGQDMRKEPASFRDFLSMMKARHFTIMEARPDKRPGEFKEKPNRAGETFFVAPELVVGTLEQGFEMSRALEDGLARAVFVMFVVSEVHPFDDGNGRIARVMMNAELMRDRLCRIIVPTVFRDDYLRGLRRLSRKQRADALIKMMDFAQRFAFELPLSPYESALRVLTACHAFQDPDEGRLLLPSQLSAAPASVR